MTCDQYWKLLSARLDGALTGEENQALEEHLAVCPDCRAEQSRLAAIHAAFGELEEIDAPEGFTQGVMDRVRAEAPERRAVSLFQRPRFRALAGLAACLVLAAGLYSAARQQDAETLMLRSFSGDAAADVGSASGGSPMGRSIPEDPMTAVYSAPDPDNAVPAPCDGTPASGSYENAEIVLMLDRLPEGEDDPRLLDAEPDEEGRICLPVTREQLERTERMAQEQGINASRFQGAAENGQYIILFPCSADEPVS